MIASYLNIDRNKAIKSNLHHVYECVIWNLFECEEHLIKKCPNFNNNKKKLSSTRKEFIHFHSFPLQFTHECYIFQIQFK